MINVNNLWVVRSCCMALNAKKKARKGHRYRDKWKMRDKDRNSQLDVQSRRERQMSKSSSKRLCHIISYQSRTIQALVSMWKFTELQKKKTLRIRKICVLLSISLFLFLSLLMINKLNLSPIAISPFLIFLKIIIFIGVRIHSFCQQYGNIVYTKLHRRWKKKKVDGISYSRLLSFARCSTFFFCICVLLLLVLLLTAIRRQWVNKNVMHKRKRNGLSIEREKKISRNKNFDLNFCFHCYVFSF